MWKRKGNPHQSVLLPRGSQILNSGWELGSFTCWAIFPALYVSNGKHKGFNTDLNSTHGFTSRYALKISLPVSLTANVLFRATMPVNLKQPTRQSPVMLSPLLSILPCVMCLFYSSSSCHCPKLFCNNFIRSEKVPSGFMFFSTIIIAVWIVLIMHLFYQSIPSHSNIGFTKQEYLFALFIDLEQLL